MAIAFTYDESTNVVVVTGGTSGTPADFDDFVTADRAGTAELTPEDTPDACTTNMTLTYQIRPVEALALQITFTLAGTSAGAGDTLDVTGTDWDGVAQGPESIDVSGGDGAYTGANKWRTITDIDCTGWADGTLKVTQPQWGVIWDYGNNEQYQLDANWDIGNNSTSTYFQSKNDAFHLSTTFKIRTRAQAHCWIGELAGDWGVNGSYWSVAPTSSMNLGDWTNTDVSIYASHIHIRNNSYVLFRFSNAYLVKNSILSSIGGAGSGYFYFNVADNLAVLERVYINNTYFGLDVVRADTMGEIHAHNNYECGVVKNTASISEISNTLVTHSTSHNQADFYTQQNLSRINMIDSKSPIGGSVVNNQADNWVQETYTCNIHIVDKDGVAIQTVAVLCEDESDNDIFDVTTDASGDIAEQEVPYKRWSGTSETLTTYSPHKFTISKAGYETLILEAITVDAPIVWHLELQAQKQPVAAWQEGMM